MENNNQKLAGQENTAANSDINKALAKIAEVGQMAKNIEQSNKARTNDALACMNAALARFR